MKSRIILLLFCLSIFSCGLEEAYYLPQVAEGLISASINTVDITIEPINESHARYYSIFYRIYISGEDNSGIIDTPPERNSISTDLERDFNAIFPYTNPLNTSEVSTSLFSSRNYFKLELEGTNIDNLLSTAGKTITTLMLDFPTAQGEIPYAVFNNDDENKIFISRSTKNNKLKPDQFFLNTSELNEIDTTSSTNIDVAGRTVSPQFAYVSMYIVAEGWHSTNFSVIFSKPTHIGIFKLP